MPLGQRTLSMLATKSPLELRTWELASHRKLMAPLKAAIRTSTDSGSWRAAVKTPGDTYREPIVSRVSTG